jgi:HK97 family phage prohead protease
MEKDFDFSGWATRYNVPCSDGRTIKKGAFDDLDGKQVPLVWMHNHDNPLNVLGHATLFSRPEGIYTGCKFNNTDFAKHAKEAVANGDVKSLSIYANKLKQQGGDVLHGVIREVSLVLAGANPEAYIDYPVIEHSDGTTEDDYTEAIILYPGAFEGDDMKELEHADEEKGSDNRTVQDVLNTFNEEQKKVLYYLVAKAAENGKGTDDSDDEEDAEDVKHDDFYEGEDEMKHNVFDRSMDNEANTLSHDAMTTIIKDGKRYGSLKESVLEHAEEYGIDGLEWLFPEDRNLNNTPEFIKRDTGWVTTVMRGVSHSPFSRVKSQFANITEDEARAKGYIKGNYKKEEVFSLLKRSTTPQTVYKKQKMDRDDIIDITDFDVVAWLKGEMRMMLDEELARAYLIGDGRLASDEDKISEDHIRPIANDADLFTIKKAVTYASNATDSDKARAIIKAAVKARKDYKGSGNPTFFTTEDTLTELLLIEDGIGRLLYADEAAVAKAMRVSSIVTVPVMENHQVGGKDLIGIIVNLTDYRVGADKGGAINMFEDFDIDYNQEKYLIETRCSGALVKPYSAIVLFDEEVPVSVDGGVKESKTTYVEFTPESGANPKALGLYEVVNNKYVKTTDTTVSSGKTYYKRISYNAD